VIGTISRTVEFERDRQARLAERRADAALRRMQPHPIAPTTAVCSCCGEEFEITWCGEHDGPAACGRDLADPREHRYRDAVFERWLRRTRFEGRGTP
jgi:hypothetical protein